MDAQRAPTTLRCRLLGHAWVHRAADDSEVCSRRGCVFARRIGDWFPTPDRHRTQPGSGPGTARGDDRLPPS